MVLTENSYHHPLKFIVPRQLTSELSTDSEVSEITPSNPLPIFVIDIAHNSRVSFSSSTNILRKSSEDDSDGNESIEEDHVPPIIPTRRRISSHASVQYQKTFTSRRSDSLVIHAPDPSKLPTRNSLYLRAASICVPFDEVPLTDSHKDSRGQTLLHLAARLGHDKIIRLLMSETSQANGLMNARGQTPLLTALESGSTSTAIILMESDPRSIIVIDDNRSSVFHYACEHCNDVVLNRAIALLKRLNSTVDRMTGLRRMTERNLLNKSAFDIAIGKGQLKCVKQFLLSPWLESNIDIGELINAESMKNAIDQDQLDILTFFVVDIKRFAYIIDLVIDVYGRSFNLLEYAIYLRKKDIIRLLISVRIPTEQRSFHRRYKSFLQHYSESFDHQSGSLSFYQTPLQRMLLAPECVPLVPLILEQFVHNSGMDLSILDDCLFARPGETKCIFGRAKEFSVSDWSKQHPLTLIANADCKAVSDHQLVRMCVDLKFDLFGNILYLLMICCQSIYVALYTGITLGSPTPASQGTNYYEMVNYSCIDLCLTLANDVTNPAQDQPLIRAFRMVLLIFSCLAITKEFYKICMQRDKYFHRLYINLIELHMYVSAIIYVVDVNECTRQTGIRCSVQWMAGGIGLLSVWTSLLLVMMNGIKFGKYGLLLITVSKTFLKFIFVYIFIWIGFILAFYMICKDILDQFRFFNFIPKLLVMLIGEYDMDGLFFPNNNEMMPGAEAALILYSAYIFTMLIVMTNIMGGLAVADVKEFRLNAKREHLRDRIEVILSLQAHLGAFCETIGSMTMKMCHNPKWQDLLEKVNLMPTKYQLQRLEIRPQTITIPRRPTDISSSGTQGKPNVFYPKADPVDEVHPETGYYVYHRLIPNDSLSTEDGNVRLVRKTDEMRDMIEESTLRTNNELRKIVKHIQKELEDIKQRLRQQTFWEIEKG